MEAIKKIYRMLALLALVHVVAIGVAVGYFAMSGKVTPDRVRAAIDVLRNESIPMDESAKQTPDVNANDEADSSAQARTVDADAEELRRLNLQRVRMHAEQQLILAKRQIMEARREREEFERRVAQFNASREQQSELVRGEAFEKELEILSQLKSKIALDRLLLLPVDDAARLLMQMDTRKSRKIIEAAHKDQSKWSQMMEIQEQMRQLTPPAENDRGDEELAAGATS